MAITKALFERLMSVCDRGWLPYFDPFYPPLTAWPSINNDGGIKVAWKKALRAAPYGIYAHIPFCPHICSFCGIVRYKLKNRGEIERYLDSLSAEAHLLTPFFKASKASFLVVGGGTPSLLSAAQLDRLFCVLKRSFPMAPNARIALEAAPASLTFEKLNVLAKSGVGYLSLGVQSLDKCVLSRSGRPQSLMGVGKVYDNARKAGIPMLNMDLMYGLPGQDRKSFLDDVKKTIAWRPDRVHLYAFSPNMRTTLSAGPAHLEDLETWRKSGLDMLTDAGYLRNGYEADPYVYLTPEANGWPTGDEEGHSVVGLGIGAISYAYEQYRYRNTLDLDKYHKMVGQGSLSAEFGCQLSRKAVMINHLMSEILQHERLSSKEYRKLFGEKPENSFGEELRRLMESGFLRKVSKGYSLVGDRRSASMEFGRLFFEKEVLVRMAGALAAARPSLDGNRS